MKSQDFFEEIETTIPGTTPGSIEYNKTEIARKATELYKQGYRLNDIVNQLRQDKIPEHLIKVAIQGLRSAGAVSAIGQGIGAINKAVQQNVGVKMPGSFAQDASVTRPAAPRQPMVRVKEPIVGKQPAQTSGDSDLDDMINNA